MFYTLKNYPKARNRLGNRALSVHAIQFAVTLMMMLLLLSPAEAATTSVLTNRLLNKSSSTSGVVQSVLDPAFLLDDIKKKLAATKAELARVPVEPLEATSTGNEENFVRRLQLRQLVFLYQGQISRLASLQVIQQRRLDQENQAANWSGFTEPTAHPFLRADAINESITNLSKRVNELESWLPSIEQAGTQIVTTAENSMVKLRQADEAVEQAKGAPEQQALLNRQREILVVKNQIDLARALGYQIEKQAVQEKLLATRAQLQLARKKLSVASENIELTQQDIDQVNKIIENESQHIIAELKQALSAPELDIADQQEKQALKVTTEAVKPQSADLERLDQIREAQRSNTDIKLQALNRMLVYLQMQRDIWNLRYVYAKVTDREKASVAFDKIAKNQTILKAVDDYISQQRQSVLTLVSNQSVKELDSTVSESDTLNDELRNLNLQQVVSWSRLLGSIESTQNLLQRCKQELDQRFAVKSFSDYLAEAMQTIEDVALQIWNFEIFAVQDNIEVDGQIISGKRSVTIDKVVTAIAILIVGYWFASHLARLIEGHAVKRLSMDASLARIARRWILFLEVMLLVVLSMMVVKIPLTIFAFMGGAFVIGAGFGMQNLLKNLISGLMLLFERPFRPGDVVEVAGIRGRIMDIGVRSSQILDANGIETLIPNSTFIEQNVTNWTLTSKSVRVAVNLGVAYGSPVKEVNKLLLDIADRHGMVLKDPAPQVLFEDFGSDSLLFGLYFWVVINPDVSWKTIASDLRYMISRALAEHGIEIAFPQRDIHLNASRPLDVRVISDALDNQSDNSSFNQSKDTSKPLSDPK